MSLCLPFGLAVGWERLARRISDSSDLEQQLHMAVLGEITRIPVQSHNPPKSAGARIGMELRVFQESIDSLRTALTLSDDLQDMRILAVTSAANHRARRALPASWR